MMLGLHCEGDSGYEVRVIIRPNRPKFTGTHIKVSDFFKIYIELKHQNELYEIKTPIFAVHNLIFGKMYIDLVEQCTIKNLSKDGE